MINTATTAGTVTAGIFTVVTYFLKVQAIYCFSLYTRQADQNTLKWLCGKFIERYIELEKFICLVYKIFIRVYRQYPPYSIYDKPV